ncbi:MAG: aldehyde ferredoxin oxidoreductase N-terminal domain-containing protein [Bacillota bacterium]
MSIVRVDIGMKNVSIEELRPQYRMLGARGLVSTLVADEVNPGCDPLGRENKVIFAPGLLGGTIVPSSSRTSLGTKSPLTGGIKESSAGGPGGADLAKLGINALIIEGYPQDDRWYYLKIDNNGTQILPADDLVGLGCYDTSRKLRKIHGEKCSVFVIGQAGE